jgi:hypothetical protein
LDFAVLGFPKTGTTFVNYALRQHPQVVMPPDGPRGDPMEFCQVHRPDGDERLRGWLRDASSSSVGGGETTTLDVKYGIKCPTMIRSTNAIENLMKVSDSTKLIVGVRHPLLWFQSFYNYRVYEHYNFPEQYPEPIPSPLELNDKKEWRDVTMAYAKFDAYLKQLMKVPLSAKELKAMMYTDSVWEKRATPNPYEVFIYTSEQLSDKNATRQASFRKELQTFMGLDEPLVDFNTIPNINQHDEKYPEFIDLCNHTYASMKHKLLGEGKKSSAWIVDRFIHSKEVFVGNRGHFVELVRGWGEDPCKNK